MSQMNEICWACEPPDSILFSWYDRNGKHQRGTWVRSAVEHAKEDDPQTLASLRGCATKMPETASEAMAYKVKDHLAICGRLIKEAELCMSGDNLEEAEGYMDAARQVSATTVMTARRLLAEMRKNNPPQTAQEP